MLTSIRSRMIVLTFSWLTLPANKKFVSPLLRTLLPHQHCHYLQFKQCTMEVLKRGLNPDDILFPSSASAMNTNRGLSTIATLTLSILIRLTSNYHPQCIFQTPPPLNMSVSSHRSPFCNPFQDITLKSLKTMCSRKRMFTSLEQ